MGNLCRGETMGGDELVTDLRSFRRYLRVRKNNYPYINYLRALTCSLVSHTDLDISRKCKILFEVFNPQSFLYL